MRRAVFLYAELAGLVQHRFAKPAFRKGARLRWSLLSTDRSGAEKSGFKSHRGHCGYSITVSTADCGSANEGSTPFSHPMGRYA